MPDRTHPPRRHALVETVIEDLDRDQPPVVKELTDAQTAAIEPERVTGRVVAMLSVLVVAALIAMLNETALSVALPAVMGDLQVTADVAQWLTTGFMLTMAVVIPTTGFLLERFTTRALFAASMVLFVAGTLLAALAPDFQLLLLGRVLQASGTAIILPQLMATTLTAVPARHRGTVMGLNAVVISAAPALGPTLSGFVVDALSWRWLFGLMVPVALVVLVAGLVVIRTDGDTRRAPLDVLSVLLSALAFGGIVYALSSISTLLSGPWVPSLALAVGVVSLVLFVRRQLALQRGGRGALLDLAPFTVPAFRRSVVVVGIAMATMLGTVMVLPLHLQRGMAVSAVTTGLLMLPGGLIQGVISPLAGRVFDAVGPRPLVVPGAVLLAGGQFLMSTLGTGSALWFVVVGHVVFCSGMALVMTPLMTLALGSLPARLYGHGSAIMNTMQQLAGAAGTAFLIAAMTIGAAQAAGPGTAQAEAQAVGTRVAFLVGGVVALVAVGMAPTIRGLAARRTEDVPAEADADVEERALEPAAG